VLPFTRHKWTRPA